MLFPFLIQAFLTVILLGLFCHLAYRKWAGRRALRLPPGPLQLPILGNVHQLPQDYQEKTLARWGRQYGDIVFAQLFRTPAVIISSVSVAKDLMEKRSANYSSRPHFVLQTELMGWDSAITHMPYNDRFRKHRKWIQDAIQSKSALLSFRSLQYRETYTFLTSITESPDEFMSHIRRFAAALIMEITYGHTITSLNDQFLRIAERATTETVANGSPGSMLVDFFPILKHMPLWMPGAGFLRRAAQVKYHVRRMLDKPYDLVKNRLATGTASPSFTSALLEQASRGNVSNPEEEEEDIKGAAGVLFAAGSDTTVSVLSTFLLAMVLHPEVYQKAQTEIHQVTGGTRLPGFEDREQLPYLACVLKELLRWHCPVPLGIPHLASVSDEYSGYDIPQGSLIIPNIWAMTQRTDVFPDPSTFRPERFMEPGGQVTDSIDPANMVFGFGRRVCPGQDFADASIWLLIANMVATMDISRAQDTRGNDITPSASFTSGFVSHPKPFKCRISPRSASVIKLISDMSTIHA
ncbi:cytochrome P450 monooxygenase [Obba rivulosa]|uniref:Cytochrome P450 monooxygenase n=1 Tax=Obba rivulosa TaxID=1052685 RepID=A0A8E2AXX0_9APHY|nr:cytochrome P450 monooxygenase [Obba rivulosa]